MQPVVAYYRVSTARRGRSGLGLDAQRERCAAFAAGNGMATVEAFTEVETGKGSDASMLHGPGERTQSPQPRHGSTSKGGTYAVSGTAAAVATITSVNVVENRVD